MKFKENFLFYLGYFLLILSEMLQTIPIINENQDNITFIGLILICIYNIAVFIKKREIRNITTYNKIEILMLTISIISYLITKNFTIIKFFILIFSISNLTFEKFIKNDFKIKLILTFILFIAYFIGITDTRIFYRLDGTVRYTLGFIHPNTFGFYTMILAFEYFYINREKITIKQYVFSFIIFLINWKISHSRTCALILLIFIIYNLLKDKWINKIINKKIIKNFITYSFLAFTIISLLLGIFYKQDSLLMSSINEILSLRPQNYELYLSSYPINLLGNDIPGNLNGKFLDNTYLTLILNFGIIQYLIYLILVIETIKILYEKNENYLIIIFFLLFIYGMMEGMIIKSTMNAFILVLILPFTEQQMEESKKNEKKTMKRNKMISIIVPIYNAEEHLKKCLDSILAQSYKNLEIILINDGSTDSSNKICKEYQKIDSRIQLLESKNEGVSAARNTGLKVAKGEYVSFIDSDDSVDPNFIMKMYENCKKNNVDICVVNMNYEYSNKVKRPLKLETKIVSKDEFYKLLAGGVKGFITNKMYRKSILKGIYFDTGITIGEDLLFNVEVTKNAKKISVLNEHLYNYYQNPKSAYNCTYSEKKITEIYAYDKILEIIKENSAENLIFYQYQYLKIAIDQKNQYVEAKCKNNEVYQIIKNSIDKYYKEIMRSKKVSVKQKLYILMSNRFSKLLKFLKFIKNKVI